MPQGRHAHLPVVVALAAMLLAPFHALAADPPVTTPAATGETMLVALLNARVPQDGVLSGGQPTPEQIDAVARAGFRTVINLRTERERGYEWEREAVARHGMHYVQIPIAGAPGLTRENVERIDAALRQGLEQGPVLLHCAGGDRIGAVLALRRAWLHDAGPEEALRYGLASGLRGLEGAVRELLEREPAP